MSRKLSPLRFWLYKKLSTGFWSQLNIFLVICFGVMAILGIIAWAAPGLSWVEAIGAFLDPGVFGGIDNGASTQKKVFLFVVSLLSIFLVASMIISVISNTFSNITQAFHEGYFRKPLKDFTLIIGSGEMVPGILRQAQSEGREVVVFASSDPDLDNFEYYYYHGDKTSGKDLQSIGIENAGSIYILSDKHIADDDSSCLTCLDLLRGLSEASDHKIHCYVVVNKFTTTEIFSYSKNSKVESGNLFLVDIINVNEYVAEQLMLHSDLLPVIKEKDGQSANIIILGAGDMARGVAYTAAHICHYPRYGGQIRKTRITLMDPDVTSLMDRFLSSRPGLFELSTYTFVDASGKRTIIHPKQDFTDVEWEFAALSPESRLGQAYLTEVESDSSLLSRYVICPEDTSLTTPYYLHLPRISYRNPIAVHSGDTRSKFERASATGMFGNLITFGIDCMTFHDDFINQRSSMGKRVNRVYDKAYGNPPSQDAESAWYKITESDKLSSIYCALALPLRRKCFPQEGIAIYEAEHRRWVISELLMGYAYSPKKDKAHFLHPDIIPYEELPKEEQYKDKLLIDATGYILNGEDSAISTK